MKKLIYIILILIIIAGGYTLFDVPSDNDNITYDRESGEFGQYDDSNNYFYEDEYRGAGDEGYVIETEVDGPEDCVSMEKYDEERGVCYIECGTPAQCDEVEAKLDAALDALDEDFQEFSKGVVAFKGNASDLEEEAGVVYNIEKGEKFTVVSGTENANHIKVKSWLAQISPNKFSDTYLNRLIPYTKPGADTMAYVTPNMSNPAKWDMYVNMDTMRDGEKEMVFTLIHEFMHILTLNNSQVNANISEEDCEYYIQEGCVNDKAYMKAFYDKYWKGKFNPNAQNPDENYSKNPKAFVTEYAATNTGEDIAESREV